jgi:hypothetical protein
MPALPTLDPPTWNVTPGGAATPRSDIQSVVQSVVFVQLSEDLAHRSEETVNGDVLNGSSGNGAHTKTNKAGAVIIHQETASSTPNASTGSGVRTRLELVGFERREVELAEGFAELSGEASTCLAWDWVSLPVCATCWGKVRQRSSLSLRSPRCLIHYVLPSHPWEPLSSRSRQYRPCHRTPSRSPCSPSLPESPSSTSTWPRARRRRLRALRRG